MLLFGGHNMAMRYDIKTNKSIEDSAVLSNNLTYFLMAPKVIMNSVYSVDENGNIYADSINSKQWTKVLDIK